MRKSFLALTSLVLITGCVGTTSDSSIRKATSNALGIAEHEFTFGNRQDSFTDVKYEVKTKQGSRYKCVYSYAESALNSAVCTDSAGNKVQPPKKKDNFK